MIKNILVKLYRISNPIIRKIVKFLIYTIDGNETTSKTLREIFKRYYDVEIGLYTYGGCFIPNNFGRKTIIGRYCSIATSAFAFNRNHPLELKSSHAYFFNPALGCVKENKVEYIPLKIENDVWIGHNSIILPKVKIIGTGAVIAAGSVVTADVPPYAVVAGNPAHIIKYRFSKKTIKKLLESRWWEKSIGDLKKNISEFIYPLRNI